MLYMPVTGHLLTLRFAALGFGAIFVMGLQYIVWGLKKLTAKKALKAGEITAEEYDDASGINERLCLYPHRPDEHPEEYSSIAIFGNTLHFHKARGAYALRVALLTALAAFAADILAATHISTEGRWMTYTVFSLTEIFSEDTRVKTKERIQGTIIGLVLAVTAFIIAKTPETRMVIVMMAGYLAQYFSTYRGSMIMVTVTALGSLVSIASNERIIELAGERLLFVAIGAALALLVNKYVYPTLSKHYHKVHPSYAPSDKAA